MINGEKKNQDKLAEERQRQIRKKRIVRNRGIRKKTKTNGRRKKEEWVEENKDEFGRRTIGDE